MTLVGPWHVHKDYVRLSVSLCIKHSVLWAPMMFSWFLPFVFHWNASFSSFVYLHATATLHALMEECCSFLVCLAILLQRNSLRNSPWLHWSFSCARVNYAHMTLYVFASWECNIAKPFTLALSFQKSKLLAHVWCVPDFPSLFPWLGYEANELLTFIMKSADLA